MLGQRTNRPAECSRPGRTTLCLTIVPRPHGEFNLGGYLT